MITMTTTFLVNSVGGISGSLTKLVDGSSYILAGPNVTISSRSNGSVLIAASTGSNNMFPLGLSGSLTRLTDGTSYLLAGPNVSITSQSNGSVLIAAVTGSNSSFVNGLSGSLTTLTDGSSYLVAGPNVTITSQSNGSVLIAASTGSTSLPTPSGVYGDGSDGAVTISSATTLSRDMFYSSLTVNAGVTLSTNGYRVFVAGACIVSGAIDNSGVSATHNNSTGAPPGAVGSIGGTTTNPYTGKGGDAPSGHGGNVTGIAGLNAHGGSANPGGGGGGYTSISSHYGTIRSMPFAVMGVCISSDTTVFSPSGGAGGGASAGSTGGGGGGGVVILAAASINVALGGSITANGGAGAGDASGGSGGGGGGIVVLISQTTVQNSGTITAMGGVGGSGFGGGTGLNGGDGAVITLLSL